MLHEIDLYKFSPLKRYELLRNVKDSITYGLQNIEYEQRLYRCSASIIKCQAPSPLYGDIQTAYILRSYSTYIALIIDGDMFDVLLPMYGRRTNTSSQHLRKTIEYLSSKNIEIYNRYKF